MSTKYADDYLRYSNNRSMFRSIWHLGQLWGRRTIKWDVNIVNDAENKICELSLGLYHFQSCRWSPFRWLFPGVTREEKIVSMGPRCVSLSREGNFITYNFFISLREKIFSKLLLRTWWLMPNIFSSTCSRSAKFTILIQGMFLSTVSFLLPTLSVHITTGPFLWNGRKTQLLFDDHPVNLIFPHIVVLFIVFTKNRVQMNQQSLTVPLMCSKELSKGYVVYIIIELFDKIYQEIQLAVRRKMVILEKDDSQQNEDYLFGDVCVGLMAF